MTPQEQNQTVGLSVEDEVLHSQDIATEKRKFPESLVVFAKHKLLIEWFVGTAIVLSVVVSLLLPKSYTATARILPPQQSQSVASAVLSQLGDSGLSWVLGSAGTLGSETPTIFTSVCFAAAPSPMI